MSENHSCPICNSKNITKTDFKLRDSSNLSVLKCEKCSLYYLSSFNHINEKFYDDGNMASVMQSPKLWLEYSHTDDLRRANFLKNKIKNKKYLDFGCGAGGVLLLTKDIANVSGIEKCKSLYNFYSNQKLKVSPYITDVNEKFDIISMFHVLEHLSNPKIELEKLLKQLDSKGELIIEVPNSSDALISLYKCKAFINYTHWSCHLFSFNKKSLKKMLLSIPNLKINYIKNISRFGFANHMYWIFKGKKCGHKIWTKLNFFDFIYKPFLKLIQKSDTLLVSISKKY